MRSTAMPAHQSYPKLYSPSFLRVAIYKQTPRPARTLGIRCSTDVIQKGNAPVVSDEFAIHLRDSAMLPVVFTYKCSMLTL